MEDDEQPSATSTAASAPQVAERPLWDLNREEQRVLIITFVGGLASIVAGVCRRLGDRAGKGPKSGRFLDKSADLPHGALHLRSAHYRYCSPPPC